MRIPESKIEEIRSAASIVDVISGYVQLKKRGRNYLGLCPFHSEKTPSFTVSEEKQIFHCFGCHAGGNVYKFLMDYEKISFVEAVQELARQMGIDIEYESFPGDEKQSEQEVLYDINTEAAKYFYNNLQNSNEGELARKYLKERKIKPQTITSFGLGYALRGWENFLNYAKEKKLNLDKVLELGLLGKNNDGRFYDKFAGRLIFPIFSPNGRVVAFAGRVLDKNEKAAKYLNSPESSIYIKGRILYGLSFAKDEIRKLDKVILVEGYMDLISLYQSGIKNVVAVSGTALTEEQTQLLSRYTKNVVLLFDADTAGIKASMRSIELLLKRDMEVKIAELPGGEDPDSFINSYGKEKFEDIISYAKNFLEYQSENYEKQGMFNDPAKMAEAIRELVKSAALINDDLKRNLLIKSISKKFNLREILIENELDKILKKEKPVTRNTKPSEETSAKKIIEASSDNKITDSEFNTEKEIIKLIFEGDKDVVDLIIQHVDPFDFNISFNRNLFLLVTDAYNEGEPIVAGALLSKIEDEKSEAYLRELSFEKYGISKIWDDIFPGDDEKKILIRYAKDTLIKFKSLMIERMIKENNHKLISAPEDEKILIMKKTNELRNEKTMIIKVLSSEEVTE